MFVLYNAALRGFPPWDVECLLGNKYETSIFVIASGITKLSKVNACPAPIQSPPLGPHSTCSGGAAARFVTALPLVLQVTDVPANRLLYRGLGGMVLPDHFWRTFDECQVSICVQASSREQARAVAMALRAAVLTSKREVLDSKHTLEAKVLKLEGFPAPGQGSMGAELRVVCDAELAGVDRVSMVVAVPMSKYDFTANLRAVFSEAVGAICGLLANFVMIEDVIDKPSDFKGAG
jgi:hypothetical protein